VCNDCVSISIPSKDLLNNKPEVLIQGLTQFQNKINNPLKSFWQPAGCLMLEMNTKKFPKFLWQDRFIGIYNSCFKQKLIIKIVRCCVVVDVS